MSSFTSTGSTSGGVLVGKLFAPSIVNAVFYNGFLGLGEGTGSPLFAKVRKSGDTGSRWAVRKTGAGAELFVESAAAGTPSSAQYAEAYQPWTYARSTIRITGHARDAMGSAMAGSTDVIAQEINAAALDVADLLTTTLIGTTYGIEAAVDSTTTYAGIARGSATWFESYEDGTNSLAGLRATLTAVRNPEHGGMLSGGAILVPHAVAQWYDALGGSATTYTITTDGRDKMYGLTDQKLAGIPFFSVPDMTATVLIMLDTSPRNPRRIEVIRPVETRSWYSGDDDVVQISSGCALVIANPVTCAKQTGLS